MPREALDLDALEHWWRPGALPRWATIVLLVATATTIAVVELGARWLIAYLDPGRVQSGWWLRHGVTVVACAGAAAAWLPRWRLSRAVRAAIALPALQLVAIALAWLAWRARGAALPDAAEASPLVAMLPFGAVLVAAALALAIRARLIGGPRRREQLHTATMLALLDLLLVGLWLPLAAAAWCAHQPHAWWTAFDLRRLVATPAFVAFVLAPPLVVSTAITAVASRCAQCAARARGVVLVAGFVVLLGALLERLDPTPCATYAYANCVHVLLALAAVAATTLATTAIALRASAARRHRALAGTALHGVATSDDDEPLACLQIPGWLRGPRMLAAPFTVATRAGAIAVPANISLAIEAPPISTRLAPGDAIAVLRPGDRVVLAGFVPPAGDGPFRSSAVPLATPGSIIARLDDEPTGFAAVALALWRPCIAYLLVVVAVALPGLATALALR